MKWLALIAAFVPSLGFAETVFATRTLRPQSIIAPGDLEIRDVQIAGMASDGAALIGQEVRIAIYAGRPIRAADVGPPAIIERNQHVTLRFLRAGLAISVEGRALDRAGVGDRIRAMNLSSRNTVFGTVLDDGSVVIGRTH